MRPPRLAKTRYVDSSNHAGLLRSVQWSGEAELFMTSCEADDKFVVWELKKGKPGFVRGAEDGMALCLQRTLGGGYQICQARLS